MNFKALVYIERIKRIIDIFNFEYEGDFLPVPSLNLDQEYTTIFDIQKSLQEIVLKKYETILQDYMFGKCKQDISAFKEEFDKRKKKYGTFNDFKMDNESKIINVFDSAIKSCKYYYNIYR